jgi:cytochrome c biogenesis protein CcdA
VADERFMHTDPVHDLIVAFRKMVFDIVEKDFVSIAGLHEVFCGINVVEHDLGSAAKGCVSTPVVVSLDLMISLSPCYLPVTPHFLDDSTHPQHAGKTLLFIVDLAKVVSL